MFVPCQVRNRSFILMMMAFRAGAARCHLLPAAVVCSGLLQRNYSDRQRTVIAHGLEAGRAGRRPRPVWRPTWPLPGPELASPCCVTPWRGGAGDERAPWGLFYEDADLMRAPPHDLSTPQIPASQSHRAISMWEFGGHPPACSTPEASPLTCTKPDVKAGLFSLIPRDLLSAAATGATTDVVV